MWMIVISYMLTKIHLSDTKQQESHNKRWIIGKKNPKKINPLINTTAQGRAQQYYVETMMKTKKLRFKYSDEYVRPCDRVVKKPTVLQKAKRIGTPLGSVFIMIYICSVIYGAILLLGGML